MRDTHSRRSFAMLTQSLWCSHAMLTRGATLDAHTGAWLSLSVISLCVRSSPRPRPHACGGGHAQLPTWRTRTAHASKRYTYRHAIHTVPRWPRRPVPSAQQLWIELDEDDEWSPYYCTISAAKGLSFFDEMAFEIAELFSRTPREENERLTRV